MPGSITLPQSLDTLQPLVENADGALILFPIFRYRLAKQIRLNLLPEEHAHNIERPSLRVRFADTTSRA